MKWSAIWFAPIDHPKRMDVWRPLHKLASLGLPQGDVMYVDRHIHAGIDIGPVLGNIAQDPPVLSFAIGTAFPLGPDGVPECALWNARAFASPLPLFSLLLQGQPLLLPGLTFVMQVLFLFFNGAPLHTHLINLYEESPGGYHNYSED